jgi:hypothetical protein
VFRLTLPRSAGGQVAGSPLPLNPQEAAEVAAEGGIAVVAGEGPGTGPIPLLTGEGPGSGGDATVGSAADSRRLGTGGGTDA